MLLPGIRGIAGEEQNKAKQNKIKQNSPVLFTCCLAYLSVKKKIDVSNSVKAEKVDFCSWTQCQHVCVCRGVRVVVGGEGGGGEGVVGEMASTHHGVPENSLLSTRR